MSGLAVTQTGIMKFNAMQLFRQRCLAAGQAQLDHIEATGQQISPSECERLWSDVDLHVETTPGKGDWEGMDLVAVTVGGEKYRTDIEMRLTRYVSPMEVRR